MDDFLDIRCDCGDETIVLLMGARDEFYGFCLEHARERAQLLERGSARDPFSELLAIVGALMEVQFAPHGSHED